MKEWFEAVDGETDRACAILCAAHVDQILAELIYSAMINLSDREWARTFEDPGAPLGSMHARIVMAHALGLISAEMMDDLDSVRQIRNAFAHASIPLTFANPLVADECARWKSADTVAPIGGPLARVLFEKAIYRLMGKMLAKAGENIGKSGDRVAPPPVIAAINSTRLQQR